MYDCEQLCGRGPGSPGDPRRRAANRCALPDFDIALWQTEPLNNEAELMSQSVGANIANRHQEKGHDLETEGCPWSWVLSEFAQSVVPFVGHRGWSTPWQNSMLFERVMLRAEEDPSLLFDAVQMYQAHADGAYAQAEGALHA